MAVELDSDERARVETARLPVRPKYYNASTLSEQTISQDFEAFLILQDAATIAETLTWLGTAGLLGTARMDRDAVLFEALIIDQQDASDQLEETTESTSLFSRFREAFQAGKFSETAEVSLILRDMQLMADELFSHQDRIDHLQHVQSRVQNVLSQQLSPAQLRQLQSWPTPLLSY